PDASCTCPASGGSDICKHVAAVVDALLAAPAKANRRAGAATDPLAGPLARIEDALAHVTRSRATAVDRAVELSWEIDLSPEQATVLPGVRRRLKSGALGVPRRIRIDELRRGRDHGLAIRATCGSRRSSRA